MKYKKHLPESLTEEQWLCTNYAVVKYMNEPKASAVMQEKCPKSFTTIKIAQVPERSYGKELWLHIRILDQKHRGVCDIDAYFPASEIEKFERLKREMDRKDIVKKEKKRGFLQKQLWQAKRAVGEPKIVVQYYYNGRLLKTAQVGCIRH